MQNLQKIFTETPPENAVSYFWFINDVMDVDVLKKQLHDMYDHHVRSVCLHPIPPEFRPQKMPTKMKPKYLSPEYFAIIAEIVQECEKLGMHYFLYDEGGWPSGGACGNVIKNHPELYSRYLAKDETGAIREYPQAYNPDIASPLPDLLQKESTLEFIRLTHEAHRQYAGEHLGKTIKLAFTDEPCFIPNTGGRITWTKDMDRIFRERKGYDITPYLEALTYQAQDGDSDEITNTRIDFMDVCTRLFVENYFLPIRDWCRAHGVMSAGHVSREDEPAYSGKSDYGSIMKVLRALDVPGIDMIWRQIYPGMREHPFPKYASSVANQNGTPYALIEIFGACGNGLKPEEMLFYINYFLVHGCNIFTFGSYPMANKDNWIFGCRPHFGQDDPLWQYFDLVHDYANRLSGMMSQGKPVRPVAVFYDIRTMWGGRDTELFWSERWHTGTAKRLWERQCGYDFLDEDVLAEAEIAGSELHAGHAVYKEVLLPPQCRMSDAARAKLDEFIAAGGRVSYDGESAEPLLAINPPQPKLRVEIRELADGRKLWFFFNSGRDTISVDLDLAADGKLVWCDAHTGKFHTLPGSGKFRWTFGCFEAALFLSGADGEPMPQKWTPDTEVLVEGEWSIRKITEHVIGESRLEIQHCHEPAIPAEQGDWRKYLGNDYSGEAEYTLVFDWQGKDSTSPVRLDLGQVCYACTAELNGKPLGRKYFGPYLFDTEDALQTGRNVLKIQVSNTLANLYNSSTAQQRFAAEPQKAIYEPIQLAFERESLTSGLLGPVTLQYSKS